MANVGILSKNTKFYFAEWDTQTSAWSTTKTEVKNLLACPSLGGDVEQIETTCLENSNKTYIPGLKDYGDLEFTFLYAVDATGDSVNYAQFVGIAGENCQFTVELPDGTTCVFEGAATPSLSAIGVNERVEFTVKIALSSDMTITIG